MGPNTLFKSDLIAEYAAIEGITKVEAEKRINGVTELIASKLVRGQNVKVANFFNFFAKERNAKQAKNPQTGADMIIPKTRTVVAKMTQPLKDRIQGKK